MPNVLLIRNLTQQALSQILSSSLPFWSMKVAGQHDPTLLGRSIVELEAGADMVIGYRDRPQRWSEALFYILGRIFWCSYDPLCGMKGYRLAILAKVAELSTYASIWTELSECLINRDVRVSQPKIKTHPRKVMSCFGGGFNPNLRICKSFWTGLIRRGRNGEVT